MEEEKTNFSFFILRKFPRIRGMKINFTCIFTYKILNNTISLKSYHLTVEIINHALWKFVCNSDEKLYTFKVQDSCRIRIRPSRESSPSPQHFETRNHLPGNRSNRLSKKKIHESEGENIEKEVLESRSSSSLETARKSKYPLCGGFKKKKMSPSRIPPSEFSRSEYAY